MYEAARTFATGQQPENTSQKSSEWLFMLVTYTNWPMFTQIHTYDDAEMSSHATWHLSWHVGRPLKSSFQEWTEWPLDEEAKAEVQDISTEDPSEGRDGWEGVFFKEWDVEVNIFGGWRSFHLNPQAELRVVLRPASHLDNLLSCVAWFPQLFVFGHGGILPGEVWTHPAQQIWQQKAGIQWSLHNGVRELNGVEWKWFEPRQTGRIVVNFFSGSGSGRIKKRLWTVLSSVWWVVLYHCRCVFWLHIIIHTSMFYPGYVQDTCLLKWVLDVYHCVSLYLSPQVPW